jgi:hypothetical protein
LQLIDQNRSRAKFPGLALLAPLFLLIACNSPTPAAIPEASFACDSDGNLTVELYGGIQDTIHWQDEELDCAGMPRPNSEGARLRLSGPLGTKTIAFILGVPDLRKGATGKELPTNVTLIEEGAGRFFATPDLSSCWMDVDRHEPLGDETVSTYLISGTVYCISPLAELNGASSISFTELKFTSRLDWEHPK